MTPSAQHPIDDIVGPSGLGAIDGSGDFEEAFSYRNKRGLGHHVGMIENCAALHVATDEQANESTIQLLPSWDCFAVHDHLGRIAHIVEIRFAEDLAHHSMPRALLVVSTTTHSKDAISPHLWQVNSSDSAQKTDGNSLGCIVPIQEPKNYIECRAHDDAAASVVVRGLNFVDRDSCGTPPPYDPDNARRMA